MILKVFVLQKSLDIIILIVSKKFNKSLLNNIAFLLPRGPKLSMPANINDGHYNRKVNRGLNFSQGSCSPVLVKKYLNHPDHTMGKISM